MAKPETGSEATAAARASFLNSFIIISPRVHNDLLLYWSAPQEHEATVTQRLQRLQCLANPLLLHPTKPQLIVITVFYLPCTDVSGTLMMATGAGMAAGVTNCNASRLQVGNTRWLPGIRIYRCANQSLGAHCFITTDITASLGHGLAKRVEQLAVTLPAPRCAGNQPLAYLYGTGRDHGTLALVIMQTGIVPRQTGERQHASRHSLLLMHQAFIGHMQHLNTPFLPERQHSIKAGQGIGAPVGSVSKLLPGGKQLLVLADCKVEWMAVHDNDA